MANQALFGGSKTRVQDVCGAVNSAGGRAYNLSNKAALAQYAATGCLNSTFYASASEQLQTIIELCSTLDAKFIAKTAIYSRQAGYMKDMPALLLAILSQSDGDMMAQVFDRIVDNGTMLRNFVQIMRSGQLGRRSLGSRPKKLVQAWLDKQTDETIFYASVGRSPSLADVIKMVHPKPGSKSRRALYGYLLNRPYDTDALPSIVRDYEAYKNGLSTDVPKVPFQMLTSLNLDTQAWRDIARQSSWQQTRMNLNTFARHGVFEDEGLTNIIAARLASEDCIKTARAFPYQLMAAAMNIGDEVPGVVRDALNRAMHVALGNVPRLKGRMHILTDVSGSMLSPVTGYRSGSSSKVRCIDVAALIASSFLSVNPQAKIMAFHDRVEQCRLNHKDGVMGNASKLASLPSGGTNCAAPLRELNYQQAYGDLVIYVSDNESWIDTRRPWNSGTAVMEEWSKYRSRNPRAKLVCIDVIPNRTSQAKTSDDILNVGGFSDGVFRVINEFAQSRRGFDHWIKVIENIE